MSANRQIDLATESLQSSSHQSEINLRHFTPGKLPGERVVRRVVFRDDKTAARVLIKAMHDAGALFAADYREIATMMKERVHQRMLLIARARVHHQPRRLVEDQQVFILEKDGERNFLRLSCNLDRRRLS